MCKTAKVFGDLDESQLLTLASYYEHVTPVRDDVMRGKTVLITAADQGAGEGMATDLASKGATVVMVTRDRARGEAALERVMTITGSRSADLMVADLAQQDSVRGLALEYQARHGKLHVLINNAGVMSPRRIVTPDGIELTLAVNHVASFLLTNLLLNTLRASAPARVVNVSSRAHRFRKIDLADLQGERRFDPQKMYAQSKLINLLFTFELARRLADTRVTVNAAEPGFTWTSLPQRISRPMIRGRARYVPASWEKTVATPIYVASSPQLEGVSGGYFARMKRVEPSSRALDQMMARRVWEISERLTGISATAPAGAA